MNKNQNQNQTKAVVPVSSKTVGEGKMQGYIIHEEEMESIPVFAEVGDFILIKVKDILSHPKYPQSCLLSGEVLESNFVLDGPTAGITIPSNGKQKIIAMHEQGRLADGDILLIKLEELKDTGKAMPMKRISVALVSEAKGGK